MEEYAVVALLEATESVGGQFLLLTWCSPVLCMEIAVILTQILEIWFSELADLLDG